MDTNLLAQLDEFDGLDILVLGEAMLDSYLQGAIERLCQEAPVPVVSDVDREDVPGGAANTAVNIESLGANVHFLSVLGDDPEGRRLRRALHERGVSDELLLSEPERETLAKHRVSGGVQMVVRFDQGTTTDLGRTTERRLIDELREQWKTCDAVVVSDYGYGICTPRVIAELAHLQQQDPRIMLVDSKRLQAYREVGVTAVKPNYREAVELLDLPVRSGLHARIDQLSSRGAGILDATGAQAAAVTLDNEGALLFERDRPVYRTYAPPVPEAHTAGAGDTFGAALTLGLAAGGDVPAAAELASGAAAVAVAKEGTAACSLDELHGYLFSEEKLVARGSHLREVVEYYRQRDRRLVFTNGCFDILHRGHITYLSRAKALGDVLIVGLNSDDSIRRLKGSGRPINDWDDRSQVLAALSCVDHVVGFDEETPENLIREIEPDVFVKGGDYSRNMLPEAPLVESLGGTVEILPYVENYSTTGLVEKIRNGRAEPSVDREQVDLHQ